RFAGLRIDCSSRRFIIFDRLAERYIDIRTLAPGGRLDDFRLRLIGRVGIERTGIFASTAAAHSKCARLGSIADAHEIFARRQTIDSINAAIVGGVCRIRQALYIERLPLSILVEGVQIDFLSNYRVSIRVRDAARDHAAFGETEIYPVDILSVADAQGLTRSAV